MDLDPGHAGQGCADLREMFVPNVNDEAGNVRFHGHRIPQPACEHLASGGEFGVLHDALRPAPAVR